MRLRAFGVIGVIGVAVIVGAAACGKKSPTAPDGNTKTGCSVIVGNKGTVTAQVDGSAFSGTTPTGGAVATQNTLTLFGHAQNDTTLTIGTVPTVGTTTLGAGIVNGASISLQTRSCSAGTGLWMASIGGGSGTITVTTVSATGASGTFSGTLVAQPGSGAAGNKVITNGQFNVTF